MVFILYLIINIVCLLSRTRAVSKLVGRILSLSLTVIWLCSMNGRGFAREGMSVSYKPTMASCARPTARPYSPKQVLTKKGYGQSCTCRLIGYWPARSICIPDEEIRDAHRPSMVRVRPVRKMTCLYFELRTYAFT